MKIRIQQARENAFENVAKRDKLSRPFFTRERSPTPTGDREVLPIQRKSLETGKVRSTRQFSPVQLLCGTGNSKGIIQRTIEVGGSHLTQMSGFLLAYIQKQAVKLGLQDFIDVIVERIEKYLYDENKYTHDNIESLWRWILQELKKEGKLDDPANRSIPHPIESSESGTEEEQMRDRDKSSDSSTTQTTTDSSSRTTKTVGMESQDVYGAAAGASASVASTTLETMWSTTDEAEDRSRMSEESTERKESIKETHETRATESSTTEEETVTSSGDNGVSIQTKLTVGAAGDRYEREADRVASEVVRHLNSSANPEPETPDRPEQEETIRRKPIIIMRSIEMRSGFPGSGSGVASRQIESDIERARGRGQPLDATLQRSLGEVMGFDFSGVRVHTDNKATLLNQSLQAKAFTTGRDVFFRQGTYRPETQEGQKLIAHELTHVVQQNR
ncbi:MAG: DUF4157 domain-containing protein [Cyanobacteria bacterium SBLK]|nr:DUF4157 domain-containing protein [Cyanobacteria bacterium SBLK]